MKNKITHLLIEFILVFLAVSFAFFINRWLEENREDKYVNSIIANLADDVKKDSANIIDAITALRDQHDSLSILVSDLYALNHKKANKNIHCTYFSFDLFEPTTATFESMIASGNLKLRNDVMLKTIKDLEQSNNNLRVLHNRYYATVESFRNTFISDYEVEHFDFERITPDKGVAFMNRLRFLNLSVESYHDALLIAQARYNKFLREFDAH